MTTDNLNQIKLLYQEIQQLSLRILTKTNCKKEYTNTYSNLLNTCFDLSQKAGHLKKSQIQIKQNEDYLSTLFKDGYKLGYTPIDCGTKQLDILLYNNTAHFDTWQPNTNPYAQLQQQKPKDNKNSPQTTDILSLFKQIKKILKQKQDSDETLKEISNLIDKAKQRL